ncbi:uncharacterized protein LOC135365854 [Ornithodoros turicata]|uniref:uncharacterized protein LOC135365854 n=1 Tax=Ornithodoros turicata TaxID=34597 RepID=UPI00313A03FE
MLRGVTSKWKQTVAYNFTGDSFDPATVRDTMFEIIRLSESIGIRVDAVISDMGGENRAFWRLRSIVASKYGNPNTSCLHPCDKGRRLYFISDPPHLLKNLRGHMVRRQSFIINEATVKKYNLPSNKVSIDHVEQLCKLDAENDLKLVPHLQLNDLNPNHYDKMKVGPAYALFNHAVSAALRMLVQQGKKEEPSPRHGFSTKCLGGLV